MTVIVRVHGSLRERFPATMAMYDVQVVADVIRRLSLPDDMGLAILVNGRLADWNTRLQDNDAVQLIPQLSGG